MNPKTKAFLEELSALCVKHRYSLLGSVDDHHHHCIWVTGDDDDDSLDVRHVWSSDGSIDMSNGEVLPQTKNREA